MLSPIKYVQNSLLKASISFSPDITKILLLYIMEKYCLATKPITKDVLKEIMPKVKKGRRHELAFNQCIWWSIKVLGPVLIFFSPKKPYHRWLSKSDVDTEKIWIFSSRTYTCNMIWSFFVYREIKIIAKHHRSQYNKSSTWQFYWHKLPSHFFIAKTLLYYFYLFNLLQLWRSFYQSHFCQK